MVIAVGGRVQRDNSHLMYMRYTKERKRNVHREKEEKGCCFTGGTYGHLMGAMNLYVIVKVTMNSYLPSYSCR